MYSQECRFPTARAPRLIFSLGLNYMFQPLMSMFVVLNVKVSQFVCLIRDSHTNAVFLFDFSDTWDLEGRLPQQIHVIW
jgi:hypothetical protein